MILDAFANFQKATNGFVISVRLFVFVCLSVLSYTRTNSCLFIIFYLFSYISFFLGGWRGL